jgi:predicted ribosomally synthesized peptide with SipW-like signal peptide
MRTAFAFGNNVVDGQIFRPLSAIGTGTVTKWTSQEVVFKNTFSETTLSFSRA